MHSILKKFGAYGVARTWKLLAVLVPVIVAYVSAHLWLSARTGWPEAYGINCSRKCSMIRLWNSPKLLGGNDIYTYLMFFVETLPLTAVVAIAIYSHLRWGGRPSGGQ